MVTGKTLGISAQDVLFISALVEMFPDETIQNLTTKIRRVINDIHTGHYIYLGLCVGCQSATHQMQINKLNINSICKLN